MYFFTIKDDFPKPAMDKNCSKDTSLGHSLSSLASHREPRDGDHCTIILHPLVEWATALLWTLNNSGYYMHFPRKGFVSLLHMYRLFLHSWSKTKSFKGQHWAVSGLQCCKQGVWTVTLLKNSLLAIPFICHLLSSFASHPTVHWSTLNKGIHWVQLLMDCYP